MSTEIYVFADWEEFAEPVLVGTLRSAVTKNKEHFSFSYDEHWLGSPYAQEIDPALHLFSGEQHNTGSNNFRVFLDSCPDRWGRLLMKRREAIIARQEKRRPRVLYEVDYLLGVHDLYRQGALRFKKSLDGDFLDNDERLAAPPISSLKELEYAVQQVEASDGDDPEYLKWLYMLMQLGYYDGEYDASYLELAQFLTEHGINTKKDLAQLWRRIIFNIAVSNTDDHLRNHGFIYHKGGWVLSPAYDINPVTPANGLHLNITDDDSSLNYDLAMEVTDFFQLKKTEAEEIKDEVLASVSQWERTAKSIGINRSEQQLMSLAFNV